MSRDDPHFRLRLPEGLKKRISSAASDNKRSINAEIVAALEEAYPPPSDPLIDFLNHWVSPLNDETDLSRLWDMVAMANNELAVDGSALRVIPILSRGGKRTITFVDEETFQKRMKDWVIYEYEPPPKG